VAILIPSMVPMPGVTGSATLPATSRSGTWWDSITNAGTLPSGLPCCPHCRGVLFEMPSAEWWPAVDLRDQAEPGYRQFVEWLRGRCYSATIAARDAYNAEGRGRR
jgi:hypothetical protein